VKIKTTTEDLSKQNKNNRGHLVQVNMASQWPPPNVNWYYSDKYVAIAHGDCREILPSLPQVDLVLTDPPYGLKIANNPFRQKYKKAQWDDKPVLKALLDIVIAKADKAIIWGGNYFDLPTTQCFLVWDKLQPQNFSSAMCEQAWTNIKMPAKIYRKWVVSYAKEHPTQKPVPLMEWCILLAGETVSIIDPFMGSGTTLRAARNLLRKSIGIEIEEKYCEIAAKRCSQGVLEL